MRITAAEQSQGGKVSWSKLRMKVANNFNDLTAGWVTVPKWQKASWRRVQLCVFICSAKSGALSPGEQWGVLQDCKYRRSKPETHFPESVSSRAIHGVKKKKKLLFFKLKI